MSWIRLDDQFADHPKFLEIEDRYADQALALWARALGYCNKHRTGGIVPRAALRKLSYAEKPEALADELSRVGLWDAHARGWSVHDYHAYQPRSVNERPAAQDLSAVRSEAGRRGAMARWQNDGNCHFAKMAGDSKVMPPDPVPSRPVPDQEITSALAAAEPTGSGPSCELDPYANHDQPASEPPAHEPPNGPATQKAQGTASDASEEPTHALETADLALPPSRVTAAPPGTNALTLAATEPVASTKPDPADEVFEHYIAGWRRVVRGNRPPKLDPKRRKLVKARLKDGFLMSELKRACDGLWCSDWHVQNKRTDFDLVMRDVAHVERFLSYLPEALAPLASLPALAPPPMDPEIAAMDISSLPHGPAGMGALLDGIGQGGQL